MLPPPQLCRGLRHLGATLLVVAFVSSSLSAAPDDALPDDWELLYFPDLSEEENGDPDADGLTNLQEFNMGTNPTRFDTDGDRLGDGDEFNVHESSPLRADTDEDGIDDGDEVEGDPATDPTDDDTDGDGLNDGAEISEHETNPANADTDDDTFEDYFEILSGSDPLDGDSLPSFPSLDGVLISEFVASNSSSYVDEDGDASDWIELWNPTPSAIDLSGWFLTDDPDDLRKWRLPDGLTLDPGKFVVVFASGKDRAILGAGKRLHTDFRLDRKSGSHVALSRPLGGGAVVASAFFLYPKQEENISFGLYGTSAPLKRGFFKTPTPGRANPRTAVNGFVKDTTFSVDRGFFTEAFDVEVTTPTPGAIMYWTNDGTEPRPGRGRIVRPTNSLTPPKATIRIGGTTCLRVMATKAGFEPTNVDTHTYIFPAQVMRQRGGPGGSSWGHSGPDWDMDPRVVNHAHPESQALASDLLEIPTISLVLHPNDFFGSGGIYISGEGVEKACSIEYLNPEQNPADPNTARGFQVDGTVQIVGGSSTGRWKNDKLSMRLKFGPDLRFPIFDGGIDEQGAARRFDTLVLDARLNNVWTHPDSGQNILGQYVRDQYIADLQNAMNGYAPRGRPVHVYIRGIYWGMYPMHERPDDNFAATYMGGDNDDYDVMKHRDSTVVHGSSTTWNRLNSLSSRNMRDQRSYDAVAAMLDVEQMIDYLLVNFYGGNTDWAHQNWYASFNKRSPEGRWRFHSWDPEHTLKGLNDNATHDSRGGPTRLHSRLKNNAEYRLLFADRIRKHFFHDGALTPQRAREIYDARIGMIDRAVRCESARWGDNRRRGNAYLRGVEWKNEYNRLVRTYFPRRTQIVLNQLINQSPRLYPLTDAPEFTQHGGALPDGVDLGITSADGGVIYYTTDGSDPRLVGGRPSLTAQRYTGEFAIFKPGSVKARVLRGNEWSALSEAVFLSDTVPAGPQNLVISKLNYRPAAPTAEEIAAGHADRNDFEYAELMNVGEEGIDLNGVRFVDGISFDFSLSAIRFLSPGERVLLVENEEAFVFRYGEGLPVAGEFDVNTELENAGERLTVISASDEEIRNFVYDDRDPWPTQADGDGFVLELIDPMSNPDHGLAENWQGSASVGGLPGINGQSFAAWQAESFTEEEIADEDVSGPLGNADRDSLSNLEEFLFGGNPKAADGDEVLPMVTIEEFDSKEYAVFNVRVRRGISGLTWQISESTDLVSWAPAEVVPLPTEPIDAQFELLRFRYSEKIGDAKGRLLRVEIRN